jgi:hypothetical protein
MLGRDPGSFVVEDAIENVGTIARIADGGCDGPSHVVHGDVGYSVGYSKHAHRLRDAVFMDMRALRFTPFADRVHGREQIVASVGVENLLENRYRLAAERNDLLDAVLGLAEYNLALQQNIARDDPDRGRDVVPVVCRDTAVEMDVCPSNACDLDSTLARQDRDPDDLAHRRGHDGLFAVERRPN